MAATIELVRRLALALPGVREGLCHGTPAFYVRQVDAATLGRWRDVGRQISQGEKSGVDPGESGRVFGHGPLSQLFGGAREFAGGEPGTAGPND